MKAVQFLPTKKLTVNKVVFKPQKTLNELSAKDKKKVDFWLAYCNVAVNLLDTGTKALRNLGIFHSRNAIFDLISEFKKLNGYYKNNEEYEKEEMNKRLEVLAKAK